LDTGIVVGSVSVRTCYTNYKPALLLLLLLLLRISNRMRAYVLSLLLFYQ